MKKLSLLIVLSLCYAINSEKKFTKIVDVLNTVNIFFNALKETLENYEKTSTIIIDNLQDNINQNYDIFVSMKEKLENKNVNKSLIESILDLIKNDTLIVELEKIKQDLNLFQQIFINENEKLVLTVHKSIAQKALNNWEAENTRQTILKNISNRCDDFVELFDNDLNIKHNINLNAATLYSSEAFASLNNTNATLLNCIETNSGNEFICNKFIEKLNNSIYGKYNYIRNDIETAQDIVKNINASYTTSLQSEIVGKLEEDFKNFSKTTPPKNSMENRNVIVQMFQWKWADIANECENFLSVYGFGGVQVPPPNENAVVRLDNGKRPWWERYKPISYKLITRSGNEQEFRDMTNRCNKVGVKIYVDLIINHMSVREDATVGTGGSTVDISLLNFPSVPYSKENFNPKCNIDDWGDVQQIRNCWLEDLADLNQTQAYVREKIVAYMNNLIDLGVAGFRVDSAIHMWPDDLREIFVKLNNLNKTYGFKEDARLLIFQEIKDANSLRLDYKDFGLITEFSWASELEKAFRGQSQLSQLRDIMDELNLLPSELALVFVDDHDSQRTSGMISYRERKIYTQATIFNLAYNYGTARILSSYSFNSNDDGPPADSNGNIISPTFDSNGQCNNGWVCEHRWRPIARMIQFRNVVTNTEVDHWWDNGNNQMGFGRGGKGFVIFNADSGDLNEFVRTGLPEGSYCDVISGGKVNSGCTGRMIVVNSEGRAFFSLPANDVNGTIAIHIEEKL